MQDLTRTTTLSLLLFSTSLWADVHDVAPGQSSHASVHAAADGDVLSRIHPRRSHTPAPSCTGGTLRQPQLQPR